MIRVLIIVCILLAGSAGKASRVVEVEDYFSKKTTDFIKMRYPNRPFTVQVKVQSGEPTDRRVPPPSEAKSVVSLPYMELSEEATEDDIWSQPDLPLGTLISYVKSVSINVEIDADFSGIEKDDFQSQLFKYLKLSSAYDQVEVRKMDWIKNPQARKSRWMQFAAIGVPIFLALFFLVVSRMSIRQLVRGLTEPLAAISKSTESMATPSMSPNLGAQAQALSEKSRGGSFSTSVSSEKFSGLLEKNREMFRRPNGEFMNFLETWGSRMPESMGAIFTELDPQDVKSLIRWGRGDWWHLAMTQPAGINPESVEILSAMSALKLRESLDAGNRLRSAETLELELSLSRLDVKQLGQVLQGYSIEELLPVFSLIPREKMINCAKYMFPGQWASLLGRGAETPSLPAELAQTLLKSAQEKVPLLGEKAIEDMFLEADLVRYLDRASTADEREVYRVLSDDSPVKTKRFPFFQVFQTEREKLQELSYNLPIQVWALALSDCDVEERRQVYESFSDRQIYAVKQLIQSLGDDPETGDQKVQAKVAIRQACQALQSEVSTQAPLDSYVKAA